MNEIDKKLHEVTIGMVRDLTKMSADHYEECRHVLLAKTADDEKLHDFVMRLFEYTDPRRPLLLEQKVGVA